MAHHSATNIIHPTAILEGRIELGEGNHIGPHAVLRGNIKIGSDNHFETGVVFENNVTIGDHNYFYPYAVIGAVGEMGLKGDSFNEEGQVRIGHYVTIREFVCIHSPVYRQETIIGDHVYLMNKSYVAHDCQVGPYAVLSSGVLLAGRCVVGEHVNIGLGTTVHQRKSIGDYAMVGMQSVVSRDILPFSLVAGNPARIMRFNRKGVEHKGFDESWLKEMEKFYQAPIQHSHSATNPLMKAVHKFMEEHPDSLTQYRS